MFSKLKGPAEITRQHAIDFKFKRLDDGIAPMTVASNLNILSTIWAKWWRHFVPSNPWADIDWPKVDKRKPAIVEEDQYAAFVNWLQEKYGSWRLPVLFLEARSYLGCRIYELAALVPEQLKDGRVCFKGDISKGRKDRECRIRPELYQELKVSSGAEYVFQHFAEQLRAIYRRQGKTQYVTLVGNFTPRRMKYWFQDHLICFRKEHPEIKRFKLHSLRATAISAVRQAGVSADKAAVYFGVNTVTMA